MKEKLKIGLLLDSYNISAWTFKMIEDIVSGDFAEITLVVLNDNDVETKRNRTLYSKIINNRGRIGYLLVNKVLEEIYNKLIERNILNSNSSEEMNCEGLLK